MKLVLVNASPHEFGCTYTALQQVLAAAKEEEPTLEGEIVWLGTKPIGSCLGCGACRKLGRCVQEDIVNELSAKCREADLFVLGSPVHYAGASGAATAFMDRLCYVNGALFAHKPCAAVVSARRAGTTSALEQLQKYFTYGQALLVGSQYWCMVHGNTPEQVVQDEEGMQIMRTLGRNLVWTQRCIEAGRAAGVPMPTVEPHKATNFIR